jgi:hypothetical protein
MRLSPKQRASRSQSRAPKATRTAPRARSCELPRRHTTDHQHLRCATLSTRGYPSFLYRHYTNIYPRPFPSYINLHGVGDSILLNFSGANELQGHRLWTLLRFGRGRLERCIFALVSFFSSKPDSYGRIYLLLRWRCLVLSPMSEG